MTLVIYVALALLIGIFEFARRRVYFFDAIFYANAVYFIFYALLPITLIILPEWEVQVFRSYAVDVKRIDLAIICFLGYTLILLGWLLGDRLYARPFSFGFSQQDIKNLVIIGLAVGIVAYFAYVSSFGGIWDSIIYGSAVRYGSVDIESVFVGRTGVFGRFVPALNIVFLYCLARLFAGEPLKGGYRAIFLSSGLFLLLYMLSTSSRGAFVVLFLATIIIASLQYKDRDIKTVQILRANMRFVWFFPIIIIIILYGKQFFWAFPTLLTDGVNSFITEFLMLHDIRLGGGTNFFRDSVVKEAAHGLSSLSAVVDHFMGKNSYLWFRDYWLLPQHMIPTKLLGIEKAVPPTVSAINTEIMHGGLISSTPPAILAMMMYNAGYPGILLMFFYGVFGRLIQNKFFQMETTPERNLMLFFFISIYGGFIGNGDIKVLAYSAFPLVLLILFFFILKLIRTFRV